MAGPSSQVKIAQKTWEMTNNIMEVSIYIAGGGGGQRADRWEYKLELIITTSLLLLELVFMILSLFLFFFKYLEKNYGPPLLYIFKEI